MKKKVFFAMVTVLFAVATMFNVNALQSNSPDDVSLDSIAVMAQANGESGGGAGKSDAMAYCSSCNGRLCTACTTKYSNGCTVYENCTISS